MKSTIIARDKEHLKSLIHEAIASNGSKCDLNHLDVSRVTNMHSLFAYSLFNGLIDQWDVSNVLNMSYMFESSAFEGDVSNWNVTQCRDFFFMFESTSFRGNLSQWLINPDIKISQLFDDSCAHEFKVPNVYHWILAVKTPEIFKTCPQRWQDHFHSFAPLTQSMDLSETNASNFLQSIWFQQSTPHLSQEKLLHFDFNPLQC